MDEINLFTNILTTMTIEEKEKFELLADMYERFDDKSQDALDFIERNMREPGESDGKDAGLPRPVSLVDGVYIQYGDTTELYTLSAFSDRFGDDFDKSLCHVILRHRGMQFEVAKEDCHDGELKLFPLLPEGCCESGMQSFCDNLCDAVTDILGKARTQDLIRRGCKIPLEDGFFIPSLGMAVAMCYWAEKGLNNALVAVSGKPFGYAIYWTSTELNRDYAWNVTFHSGYVYYNNKYNQHVTRAVAAFTFNL